MTKPGWWRPNLESFHWYECPERFEGACRGGVPAEHSRVYQGALLASTRGMTGPTHGDWHRAGEAAGSDVEAPASTEGPDGATNSAHGRSLKKSKSSDNDGGDDDGGGVSVPKPKREWLDDDAEGEYEAAVYANQTQCAGGTAGVLCATCAEGYVRKSDQCELCEDDGAGGADYKSILMGVGWLMLIAVFCYFLSRYAARRARQRPPDSSLPPAPESSLPPNSSGPRPSFSDHPTASSPSLSFPSEWASPNNRPASLRLPLKKRRPRQHHCLHTRRHPPPAHPSHSSTAPPSASPGRCPRTRRPR